MRKRDRYYSLSGFNDYLHLHGPCDDGNILVLTHDLHYHSDYVHLHWGYRCVFGGHVHDLRLHDGDDNLQ